MPYAIGIALGLVTCVLARVVGLDRDRAFYPTVVMVIAAYYILFAVMGGSMNALIVESVVMTVFFVVAIIGFRSSLWWIVGALAGHGTFDLVHTSLITNPGVPVWWPAFCMSIDILMAGFLAWLIIGRHAAATARTVP